MYPRRNFIRFAHKLDMYQRSTTVNDMGQEKASWVIYAQDVPCLYVRNGSSTGIRITPTTDETDFYLIYLKKWVP